MANYIAIEGVIGVGKTTLARLLQPHFNQATVLLEVFEENPFLADFYSDRDRYAFQTQIFFLLSRYQQQKQAVPAALRTGDLISDYTFAKDELFAWLNLADDELAMYGRVHSALGEKIPKPELIVYLKAEHQAIMQRILLRDRPYERDMDPEYIQKLAAAYDAWLSNMTDIPVLTVDVTHLDFVSKQDDLLYMVEQVRAGLQDNGIKPRSTDPIQRHLPKQGTLANYQQFHRQWDTAKNITPDLLFNFVGMVQETGEVANELMQIWQEVQRMVQAGSDAQEAQRSAVEQRRNHLRGELADMLAFVLKLANYAEIDLEEAYLEKMQATLGRQW